ncbi:MAG: hypothetical protein AAB549_01025, partial [Patescibacteria group bacterium]
LKYGTIRGFQALFFSIMPELTVPKALPRQTVDLRIVPGVQKGLAEVRMWHENTLLSVQLAKHVDLGLNF